MIAPDVRFHITGLDLSLAATGLARVRPHDDAPLHVETITSGSIRNAGYPETLGRIRVLAGRIVRASRVGVEDGDVRVTVIEAPIFGTVTNKDGKPIASAGQAHTRAGLWWLVYHLIEKESIVVHVPPSTMKSYVTGKGNSSKDLVFATMVRNYPDVAIDDNNAADALGLAAMVARQIGRPIEPSVQRCNPVALGGVKWPRQLTEENE